MNEKLKAVLAAQEQATLANVELARALHAAFPPGQRCRVTRDGDPVEFTVLRFSTREAGCVIVKGHGADNSVNVMQLIAHNRIELL